MPDPTNGAPDVTAQPVTADTTTPDYSMQPATVQPPAAPPPPPANSGPATAPASAAGPTPGVHGVLGGIVLGALAGAAKKLAPAAKTVAKGVGNEFNTLSRNSPYGQTLQKNAQESAAAKQELELKQKQEERAEQTANQEAIKNMDEHQFNVIRTNNASVDALHKVAENAHIESMYAGDEESQRNTLRDQLRVQNTADRDLLSTLESMGVHIDVAHGPGHDGLTQDHARDIATGKSTMLSNGQEGKQAAGYGFVDNTELQNTPLPHDVSVISDYTLDPKTGKIDPIYKTLTAGTNTAFDALITHDAAGKKFQMLQDQYTKQIKDIKDQEDIKKVKSDEAKNYGDANKANAEAKLANGGITDANKMLTGDPFVNTLPPGMQDAVKGLLNYQADVNAFGRGKEKAPLVEAAIHADPTWSEAKYGERKDYLKEYGTSSKGDGATRNRINTAVGHLDMLAQASQALSQTDLPKLNQIANALGVQTGKSPKIVYDAIASKAAGEVAGAVKGGGNAATDQEIEQARQNFDARLSPQQQMDNIRAQFGILNTQVGTIAGKFQSTMGKSPDAFGQPVLYGNSQDILNKWIGGGGKSVTIGGQTIPLNPDGTVTINGHIYQPSADGKSGTLVQGK